MDQTRTCSAGTETPSRPAAPLKPRTPWARPGAQLPTRGSVSLDAVAAHLQALCADGQAVAVARGVLAHDADRRHRVVTAVLVVPLEDVRATAAHVPLGDLSLVGAPLPPTALADGASLVDALATAWAAGDGLREAMRRQPAPDTAPGPPPSGYISRAWGRDARSGPLGPAPLWRVRFEGTRQSTTYAADGPFFDARLGHFYPSVQQAALAWTGTPMVRERESAAEDVYEVLIPDPRAYLADVRVLDDGYDIRVAGTLLDGGVPLHCAVVGTDVDGLAVERIERVRDGGASVRFSRLLRACTVYVLGEDGTTYDQHREDDLRAVPGDSLFTGDGGARATRARDLVHALEGGEGEHVEFKAWIPKDPNDTKAVELLQSAVAFANAGGGTIFIGVSDQADLLGVERPLRREYGREVGADLARLRDAYYADVRQRLLTVVRPRLSVRLVWVDPTPDAWVLAVHVEPGGRDAHFVERTQESFVRRGATNRRASPEDIDRMCRERGARGHRLPGSAALGGLASLR